MKIVPVNIFYSQSSSNIAAAINYAWDDAEQMLLVTLGVVL